MPEHQQSSTDEMETLPDPRSPLLFRRLLVIALYLSFFACLVALWLTGTLLGNPDQHLPFWLLQVVADHHLFVLIAPLIMLSACYGTLRHLTREIMAVPERYLDERQKMVRDQAHRSAFKVIKLACVLIPALLIAPYLPWFHQTSPVPQVATVVRPVTFHLVSAAPNVQPVIVYFKSDARGPVVWSVYQLVTLDQMMGDQMAYRAFSPAPVPVFAPASSLDIALAGGILLLCLLLLLSALPMSVIAWKRRI